MQFPSVMAEYYGLERVTTTFWEDFTIADAFGMDAIQDTFDRAFKEWRSDYKYLTELVLSLNHKIWQHFEAGNIEMSKLYDKLWREADQYACDNLKGEELKFFYMVLD